MLLMIIDKFVLDENKNKEMTIYSAHIVLIFNKSKHDKSSNIIL